MKEIKEMSLEELHKEKDELWAQLYVIKETGAYDMFEWNGLDYWDADRRHHKISQEALLRAMIEEPKTTIQRELLKNLYLRMIYPRTEIHDSDNYFMDEITKIFQNNNL